MSCSSFQNLNAFEYTEAYALCAATIYSVIAYIPYLYDNTFIQFECTHINKHSYTHTMRIFVINEIYTEHIFFRPYKACKKEKFKQTLN